MLDLRTCVQLCRPLWTSRFTYRLFVLKKMPRSTTESVLWKRYRGFRNGKSISPDRCLTKADFMSSDVVVIKFMNRHYSGVVDFSFEESGWRSPPPPPLFREETSVSVSESPIVTTATTTAQTDTWPRAIYCMHTSSVYIE